MDELVQRLSQGEHRVEASLRPEKTVEAFKAAIDRGYVHILFPDTQGGTELGMRVEQEASNFGEADFEGGAGLIHLVGQLTLNYEKVQCVADIDLTTLAGKGHLVPLAAAAIDD